MTQHENGKRKGKTRRKAELKAEINIFRVAVHILLKIFITASVSVDIDAHCVSRNPQHEKHYTLQCAMGIAIQYGESENENASSMNSTEMVSCVVFPTHLFYSLLLNNCIPYHVLFYMSSFNDMIISLFMLIGNILGLIQLRTFSSKNRVASSAMENPVVGILDVD